MTTSLSPHTCESDYKVVVGKSSTGHNGSGIYFILSLFMRIYVFKGALLKSMYQYCCVGPYGN